MDSVAERLASNRLCQLILRHSQFLLLVVLLVLLSISIEISTGYEHAELQRNRNLENDHAELQRNRDLENGQ